MRQWYCECSCEKHTRQWINDDQLKNGRSKSCGCYRDELSKKQNNCILNYSFEQWCKDINHLEYLERYDYDKNIVLPNELSMQSSRGIWLKCANNKYHPSQHYALGNFLLTQLTHDHHFKCKRCISFGNWCVTNNRKDLLSRWDCKLNQISPFEVNIESPKKYYFKCPKGKHNSEEKLICTLLDGHESCNCNACNSFGEDITSNYGEDFLNTIWDYNKNKISPYEVSRCNPTQKVFLNCLEDNSHESYPITPSHFQLGRRCPICGRSYLSKLHKAVISYLQSLNININTEHNCSLKPINPDTGYILPYDIEIVDYKIIIEIQGNQHYKLLNKNHPWLEGLEPEEYLERRKRYDKIKKDYAISNGYDFLELSTDLFINEKYKEIIQNEISQK